MNARQQLAAALPRLAPSRARAVPAWNAAGVVCAGLAGAAVVHLLAYHLPLGLPPGSRWAATALTLLASCPLSGALGAVTAVAVAVVLLALRELRRLRRLDAALARLAATRTASPNMEGAQPRSLARLAVLVVLLLGLQLALTGLVDAVCPMQAGMVMHGAYMSMAVPAALPLAPLHLIVAALLALLL